MYRMPLRSSRKKSSCKSFDEKKYQSLVIPTVYNYLHKRYESSQIVTINNDFCIKLLKRLK